LFKKNEIIDEETLVFSWDDTLAPGQFTIPFSFGLFHILPPSFYQQGPRYLAFIKYKLEAFLKPHQANTPKMKYKQSMNLRETVIKTENLHSGVTTSLKIWGCCEEGWNVLKTDFEKNYYSAGENAKVSIELDNSGTNLKNVKIVFSLKQKLEVREGEL